MEISILKSALNFSGKLTSIFKMLAPLESSNGVDSKYPVNPVQLLGYLRLQDTVWRVVRAPSARYLAVLNRTWLRLQKMEHKQRGTSCVFTARRNKLPCTSDVLWMVNFWAKIWPSKQLKATNDTLDRQFSKYSRARRSILLQTSFSFWEIDRFPVNCTHFTTFRLCKITTANDIQKMAPSGPALSIVQYVGN